MGYSQFEPGCCCATCSSCLQGSYHRRYQVVITTATCPTLNGTYVVNLAGLCSIDTNVVPGVANLQFYLDANRIRANLYNPTGPITYGDWWNLRTAPYDCTVTGLALSWNAGTCGAASTCVVTAL